MADPTPEELQKEIKALRQELEEYRIASDLWKKAEAEWSRNKRLLRMIAENAADLIAVVDRTGTRIWNNSSYQQLLGYNPDEMRGTYSMSEIHPDDLARVKAVFEDTIKSGAGQRLEYRMRQATEGAAPRRGVPIILLTHETSESNVQESVKAIDRLSATLSKTVLIRME